MQVRLILILLFLSTCCFCSANAQSWESLNGPLESSISKIIVQADTIYVASVELGGFFKKHKDADHWVFMDVVVPEEGGPGRAEIAGLNTIEIGPDGTYYVGGSGLNIDGVYFNHFYISDNFGKSWEISANGIEYFEGPVLGVHDIFISANGSLIISFGDKIFTYSEEEETFKESSGNSGVSTNRVFTFYEYEDTLLAGRVTGIEYSTDDGDSWAASSFDSVEVFSLTDAGDKLFAGTNKGLYTAGSVNGTIEPVEGISNYQINTLYTYQNQVIAGTDSGAFLVNPSNLGVQPVFQAVNLAPIKAINSIGQTILIGTENGFYECTLEEEQCTLTGVPNSRVRALSIPNEDTVFTGTIRRIYRYVISSERWDSLSVPVGRAISFVQVSADSFYTVNNTHFFACSFQSSGCDSTRVEEPGPGSALFDLKQNTAGDLFLASRSRVFKSTDEGQNWEVIYTSPERKNFSLVTYSDSLLFINSDRIKYNLTDDTYDTLSKTIHIVTQEGTIYSSSNGIQKSTDFGESWTTVLQSSGLDSGLGGLKFLLYNEEEKKLYAITTLGGVYVTENEGESWGVNKEMYPVYMESAAIGADGTLYLGTQKAGVFKNTKLLNPPITISNEEEPVTSTPNEFNLSQNYPNPFNPSTIISYQLPASSEVTLEVFDMLGRRVAVLVDGLQPAGTHTAHFDASGLASGTYIYRLETAEFSQVKNMTFIK